MMAHHEAEWAVVGAILLEPLSLALVRPHLPTPAAFTLRPLALTYEAVLALHDRGVPVDFVTILPELQRLGVERPGDVVSEAIDASVTAANVEAHARMVADAGRRRAATLEADRLRTLATDPAIALHDTVADVCGRLVGLSLGAPDHAVKPLPGLCYDVLERVESTHQPGIPTGLETLDRFTDGMEAGELWILAARPSCGKTSLGLRLARAAANAAPAFVASLEMTREKLCERMLGAEAGISMRAMRRDADYQARKLVPLHAAAGALARLPLVLDTESRTPARLRLALQAEAAQGRAPRVVVVDYLGLMKPDRKAENKNHELGEITGALKRIAMDLRVTVIALCQLNRASVRDNRAPGLHDLRDSGNIEQDADVVGLLHWPSGKAERGATAVDLILAKERDGETGTVPLLFETWTQRWYEAGASEARDDSEHMTYQEAR